MKFLCGSCRTKYQISDEKVRGKILTIRCKKCGAKILVRESLSKNAGGGTAVAPVAEEEQPKAVEVSGKKAVTVAAKAGGAAALASAFEVAMGGGTAEADDMPTSIAPVPANLDNAGVEWYCAMDGEQFGPYAFAEIVRRIVAKEIVGRHYVWHDGMDNWLRVRDVKDLAPYLPSDKKKPPPPPPPVSGEHVHPHEDETEAREGAQIVDLSVRRAEREGKKPARKDERDDDRSTARKADTASERAEQLDNVLNEALGIEGEGKTTRAEPERAIAVSGTARTKEGHSEPSIDDLLAFESKEDDLFANVPRASESDLVRESTRFFVAAAGVNARKSKNKVAMVLGGVMAMTFIGFMASWAGGIIRIELPGIGNPFAGPDGRSFFAADDEAAGDEDPEAIKGILSDEQKKAIARKRRAAARRRQGGFIDDGRDDGPGGTRGGDDESIDLKVGGNGVGEVKGVGDSVLPKSGIEDVQVDGGEGLSPAVITNVVNSRKKSVLICYQQSLKGQENLRGKLEISVIVEPSGKVKSAEVETSAFKGSKLGRCIASKIEDWRFPSFSGEEQKILVPFVLEKGNDY